MHIKWYKDYKKQLNNSKINNLIKLVLKELWIYNLLLKRNNLNLKY